MPTRKPPAKKKPDGNVVAISRRRRKATPAPRTGRGKPRLLDRDVLAEIASAVRLGNHLGTAAMFSGIGASTAYTWMARGRLERERLEEARANGEDPHPDPVEDIFLEFVERIEEAEAAAEVFAVGTVRKAMQGSPATYDEEGRLITAPVAGDWRAAVKFLELRHPQWRRRSELDVVVGGAPGRPIMVEVEERERAEVILAVLREAGAEIAVGALALEEGEPE